MNTAFSIRETHSRSSYLARRASAVVAIAALAVTAMACSGAPGGTAGGAEATASTASAVTTPWPTAWTSSQPSTSTVTDDGSRVTMHYEESGECQGEWIFQAKAPADADFIFTWDYTAFHAWYLANARVGVFAYGPNGEYVENFLVGTKDGPKPEGGEFHEPTEKDQVNAAIRVHAGYQFGFRIWGFNADSTAILRGDLTVQYRAERIVKSTQFGGQTWPAPTTPWFTNFEQIAPPGEFIKEVNVYWYANAILERRSC